MALDTTIKGDPGSVDALSRWFKGTLSAEVDASVTQAYRARSNTQTDWEGPAGEQFRDRMTTGGKKADEVTKDGETAFSIGEKWVDEYEVHKRRMDAVRDRAEAAGLTLTAKGIVDPGAGPGAPAELPPRAPQPQEQAYSAAYAAHQEHQKKVAAYRRAERDIQAIRKDYSVKQLYIKNLVDDLAKKWPFHAAVFADATIVAGVAAHQARKWAERGRSIGGQTRAHNRTNPYPESRRGTGGDADRFDRTNRSLGRQGVKAARYLRLASAVGAKVPLIGTPIAIGTVVYDIKDGKSPSQAIVSGFLSTGAGTAAAIVVGAAAGGAWGSVPGAVAGGGAGFVVGLFSGPAVDAAWEKWMPKETQDAMDGKLRKLGDAVWPG
ncbi:hypothetical protein [Plantactinospora endophytica]|uniref:Uncharacterized protein n=1 Tax=Plantactinospora endophytica TaxID=673535 RepID=A0ABQ4DXK1_9ACTN|nr:hypothetical protein [Plantactinospora endophytica]GIG87161.1 hypothetical protein Pen02_20970 [Plantactinospora endophytica]